MSLIAMREIIDVLIMTAAVGFIFMDWMPRQQHGDPLIDASRYGFDWKRFWFAVMVVAPAIILHEVAHKVTALSFGMESSFHAAYLFLGIGLLLKLVNSRFIFFIPAYVSSACNQVKPSAYCVAVQAAAGVFFLPIPLATALIAFAGPALNGMLYIVSLLMLRRERMNHNAIAFWSVTRSINGFLFIFNMLPIPLFDGWNVYSNLYRAFV